jgi:hypothetical protein
VTQLIDTAIPKRLSLLCLTFPISAQQLPLF